MRGFSFTKHIVFFLGMVCAFPSMAQPTEQITRIELLSSVTGTGGGEKIPAALAVTLADGWYTYWRMPGDSGLAPALDWSGSANVRDVEIFWPVPSRFTVMDMHSFGYKDSVLFPLDIIPQMPGKPLALRLSATFVVCKDICIPETVTASLDIDSGNAVQSGHAQKIAAAREKLPSPKNTQTLGIETAVLSQNALVVTAYAQGGFADGADLILETEPPLLFSPPEIIPDEADESRAILKLSAPDGMKLAEKLFGKTARLTLTHKGRAVEREFIF